MTVSTQNQIETFIENLHSCIHLAKIESIFLRTRRPFIELDGFSIQNYYRIEDIHNENYTLTYNISTPEFTGIVIGNETVSFYPEYYGDMIVLKYRELAALRNYKYDMLVNLEKIYKTLNNLVSKFQPQLDAMNSTWVD